ncbi:hypothetical protein BGX26_006333 [Mortierella sp. AD094]|nr:hypothetical protein BGX26_006333 [Mortierella sp. AD094]
MIRRILRTFTSRPGLWQQPTSFPPPATAALRSNEDTYMQLSVNGVVGGIFGDMDVMDHWTRDPLPTPINFEEQYLPDYFAKNGLAFVVVEVKKPETEGDYVESDRRKVPSMMKIMLDKMLEAGVESPVALGFAIASKLPSTHHFDIASLYVIVALLTSFLRATM